MSFAEMGVFILVCQHGILWTIINMMGNCECFLFIIPSFTVLITSYFIAKYPLVTIPHLLELFDHPIRLGYDISCLFSTTLMKSMVGVSAQHHGLHMVVPAFHGHAYNQTCQLSFHILTSPGFSLEDLETCECVFAGSNAVAQLTHHVTPFHHWQSIDMHFQQWDEDKYSNLGKCFLM